MCEGGKKLEKTAVKTNAKTCLFCFTGGDRACISHGGCGEWVSLLGYLQLILGRALKDWTGDFLMDFLL